MGSVDSSNKGCTGDFGSIIKTKQFIDEINRFVYYKKSVNYRITEDFDRVGRHTYNVHNLKGKIVKVDGNRLIMFNDSKHVIREDLKRTLGMFPYLNVLTIEREWECDKIYRALLTFKDGTILIERIKNDK